jgi:hypothetical protein
MSYTFDTFIQKFPEVKLPISVSEESISEFSMENDPLSEKLIVEHLLPYEETEPDDMTEYVACFRIPGLKDIHAIVFWKAALLSYEYVLATFEKGGKLIAKQTIAGTASDGKAIVRSAARIDEDFTIYIVSGISDAAETIYDATQSTTKELELLPDGRLVQLGKEEVEE